MKINFLIPATGLTGGVKVIFEHANNLAALGQEISIICPYVLDQGADAYERLKGRAKRFRRLILRLLGRNKIAWFNLSDKVKLIRTPDLRAKFIPSAEATIATANQTADWLADYSKNKGKKFYFIQDYEIWTRPKAKVDATWKLPLKKIVISTRLKDMAQEKFKENVVGLVFDGVDQKKFYNRDKKFNRDKKLLMMYHILEKKGFSDGLEAFRLAKLKHPEITLAVFGAYGLKQKLDREIEYYYQPAEEKLRELYSQSDIFLWPSREEGFGLPPLEAMACKCAVISTDTGAIRDYATAGETAIVIPPRRPEIMAAEIIKLIEDDERIKRISLAGHKKAGEFSLEKSSRKLLDILLNN